MYKIYIVLPFAFLFIAGCNSNAQVSGTVTFSDGTPYTGGRIIYEQGGNSVIGRPDENGYFQLSFEKPGSGVPSGSYRGFISHNPPSIDEMQSGGMMTRRPPPPFDPKYGDVTTAGLTFDVKAGEKKKLEIVLEPSPQR